MLGAIIGDVVGSVYEFNNTKNYHFRMFSSKSNFTDDTVLTMAVAQWAMHDKSFSHKMLEKSLLGFASEFPTPMGGYGGGFERWLFRPEELADYNTGERNNTRRAYNSWGNGSAMRVSPVGWIFDTLEETERIAGISASITHNHPEGIKGAQAVAAAIFMARNNESKENIKKYIEKTYRYNLDISWEYLHRTYGWESSCQQTVPQAIIAFLESSDFEDAIRKAVSMGGDSDTLACITGGIAEAYYKRIPMSMACKVLKLLPQDMLQILEQMVYTSHYRIFSEQYESYMNHRYFTPCRITELKENEIFVFGSNLQGMHAGGAARLAFDRFGAEWGRGVGLTGQCYAIPTMHGGIDEIRPYVDEFIDYAMNHPQLKFYVTKIGCGIAGFSEKEMAPLFNAAIQVQNIVLPEDFYNIITRKLFLFHERRPIWKVFWIKESCKDIPLKEKDYETLCRGFCPDWDFRYQPLKIGQWHYFIRAGVWVKKFRYEKKTDGLYHLVESYTNSIEIGRNLLLESLIDGYYNPRIECRDILERYGESINKVGIYVHSDPIYCPNCHRPMKRVVYGIPVDGRTPDDVVLGGCCINESSPDYVCEKCGQECILE